ncbi:MAG TPA: SRPBCC family protein, partial [Burkholderiales bacterium]
MQQREKINLTRVDRWGYAVGGLALVGWGLRRRNVARSGAAGLGSWLLYQAYTGYNPMFTPLGIRVNREPSEAAAIETIVLDQAITINASRDELYRFWRDLKNLPNFAPRVSRVEVLDEHHSRWYIEAMNGRAAVWESEITRDESGSEIAWRSTHNAALNHFGRVQFRDAPGGRGTVVALHLEYVSPAGSLGVAMARMTGQAPERYVTDALRRLKQLVEIGEVVTTYGQS